MLSGGPKKVYILTKYFNWILIYHEASEFLGIRKFKFYEKGEIYIFDYFRFNFKFFLEDSKKFNLRLVRKLRQAQAERKGKTDDF
jgi:hypothetical protein